MIESAADLIGVAPVRWTRDGCEVRVRDRGRVLPTLTLASIIPPESDRQGRNLVPLSLAELLEINPPSEALFDFRSLQSILRPRLVHPRELSGPRRTMCRREVFGGLLSSVSIGSSSSAPLVTTLILDQWGVGFERVLSIATANLMGALSDQPLHEVVGAGGVLALVSETEQAVSAAFLLGRLTSSGRASGEHGIVFSVPHDEVLLILPVCENAGADPLASMVQTTLQLAQASPRPLSQELFWWREGVVSPLPMTVVVEGKTSRVHLEAKGVLEELLRILGALD